MKRTTKPPAKRKTNKAQQIYDPNIKLPDGTISTSHAFAQLVLQRL